MENHLIRLINLPAGKPKVTDFSLEYEQLPSIADGELLLKTLYISVDPYLRAKMSGGHQPPLNAGDVMYSRAIAEIVESRNQNFKKSDHVIGFLEWKDYVISNGNGLSKITKDATSLSVYLGVLGSTGLSAYFALRDIGKPKAGETMVVSGAAGAVGSIAGQIGKQLGCRVVGVVGSDEKASFIKNKLGFDEAINYRSTNNIQKAVNSLCPNGVDVYFDNVGGIISDGVIINMNDYGRVVVCGSIASYNDTEVDLGPRLLPLIVYKKLLVQGFLIADYTKEFAKGISSLQTWLNEDKIHYAETILEGLNRLPEAFVGLFDGKNEGKMVVKVA
ncbi:NADP-dependent oxidoreductase [Mucilaginibacter achroorhodeus]|uniref:NADP-dependent oxidoreductase n=1 Tax=Mucilaginibacter achroorhodeus TaxID=2599294 RepID=A0A563U1Q3_9SPHI|nr:NADP-dependent oxidoreductase [Mucilaginibacter achroorhodeus]TWR24982.1 NADP-dependent oxidoreductase [Mucilaginibacter achroorhodeus]